MQAPTTIHGTEGALAALYALRAFQERQVALLSLHVVGQLVHDTAGDDVGYIEVSTDGDEDGTVRPVGIVSSEGFDLADEDELIDAVHEHLTNLDDRNASVWRPFVNTDSEGTTLLDVGRVRSKVPTLLTQGG